jgi:hypothetical protein
METTELHGPFDTEAEAQEAARIAVLGADCKVTEGGMWDPAWINHSETRRRRTNRVDDCQR